LTVGEGVYGSSEPVIAYDPSQVDTAYADAPQRESA